MRSRLCCEEWLRSPAPRANLAWMTSPGPLTLWQRAGALLCNRVAGNLQSLTAPTGLGLLTGASISATRVSRSGSAWLGRSQKDGLPSRSRGRAFISAVQGHRLAHKGRGQPDRCPFLIGSKNGRPDTQSCFARLPVAVLRSLRLGRGSRCLGLAVFALGVVAVLGAARWR
jgi:hypothetical protein